MSVADGDWRLFTLLIGPPHPLRVPPHPLMSPPRPLMGAPHPATLQKAPVPVISAARIKDLSQGLAGRVHGTLTVFAPLILVYGTTDLPGHAGKS